MIRHAATICAATMVVSMVLFASESRGEGRDQCRIVRDYMETVKNHCIYRFGDDREKALAEARNKFEGQLKKNNFKLPEQLNELVQRYVTCAVLGYDRLRKGDTRLLQKADKVAGEIKQRCPWD